MKSIYVMSLLFGFTTQIGAQAVVEGAGASPDPKDRSSQREQRRSELRSAIKTQQQVGMQGGERKQFSEEERAALRQQLRQQQDLSRRSP